MSEQHIDKKTYLNILYILLFLTFLTVFVAQFDFGILNALIAVAIATIKGTLVLLYFMHLKYDDKLYLVIFLSSVFFVALLFLITKIDVVTRAVEGSTL